MRGVAQLGLERLVRDQEVAGSNPVTPTFFRDKPFGEYVEGLSYFRDESCAVEPAVQKHDFEDTSLGSVVSRKPLLPQRLREFKNFSRLLGCFVVGAVQHRALKWRRSSWSAMIIETPTLSCLCWYCLQ